MDRIGDVVLSTPVIKNLRDAFPDSFIAFMAQPHARQILEGNPYLNEVIIYEKKGGLAAMLDFAAKLRKYKFDIAIILHPTDRTHLVTFLAGIPERVGYDKKMGFLLTKRIPHTKQFGLKHEIDYSLDILKYIGVEPHSRELYMPIHESAEKKLEGLFRSAEIKDGDIVVAMHPGASCLSKRWNSENFAEVGDALTEKYGAKIVIVAGAEDKTCGDTVADFMKHKPVNLSGVTTIGDLASLFKRSRLFISNDSGPVHIACAVGTPVISIFGRSDRGLSPERWGPSGKRDTVMHKDVGCEQCEAHNCKVGFKCLEAITADEVLSAADKILRGGN